MTLTQKRLEYHLQTNSLASMSRLLDTSVYFIKLYRDGLRDVPKEFYNPIRSEYQKTVYLNLKNEGFSANQANRFRWYTPDAVTQTADNMRVLVNNLSQGALIKTLASKNITLSLKEQNDLFDTLKQAIKEGINKSYKPFEAWMDYIEK